MKEIIAISGKQRSGKDTLCQALLTHFPNFKRVGLADALKDEYSELTGMPRDEVDANKNSRPEIRKELIDLANRRKEEDRGYWTKKVMYGPDNNIIVPDIRFHHEYYAFIMNNAYMIRIETPREIRATRGVLSNEDDPSEIDLDKGGVFLDAFQLPELENKDTYWHSRLDNNGALEYLDSWAFWTAQSIKEHFKWREGKMAMALGWNFYRDSEKTHVNMEYDFYQKKYLKEQKKWDVNDIII
jgi:Phosphomevalonate kinase/AAA domain